MKTFPGRDRSWKRQRGTVGTWLLALPAVAVFLLGISARASEPQMVRVHIPAAIAHLQPLGPLANSRRLSLAVGLPLRHRAALTNLLRQIYDPASPNYHHYLTPEQFTTRFGPSKSDYQAVIAFAQANGLKVTGIYPNRLLVDVTGSVTNIERALHVTMHLYQHPAETRTFYAPDTEPSLNLAVPILGISGLNNYSLPHPRFIARPLVKGQTVTPNAGSGPGGTYMGKDFRAAYVPHTPLTGTGQAVGLLEFDGYTSSDIAYYESQAGLSSVTLTNVLLDGFSGNPTGSGGEVEVSLDIEVAIAMAPGLSRVIVYEAGPSGNWHDILNRMASDDLARQLSCSWYIPGGGSDPVADQIWQEMAVQGQSFFTASGDSDAYTGLINFPGDSPYITQVGGTTLTTTGPEGAWASETVWNWNNGTGSGGGISTQYPIPYWQTNIDMSANQGSTTMRNTPDVALTADNVYVRADGSDYNVGGTSCAAPLWAGFTALVNQQAAATGEPAVGFVNPALDAIGSSPDYTACFHDITTGNNTSAASPTKFYAVPGYDLCTGWGTPNGQKLINALANPEALQITPTTGFTSLGGVGGPFTVSSQEFTLTNVGTNTLSWTLSNTSLWLNASTPGGILTTGGPATHLTVSLNETASNLVVGSYAATLWFTNWNDHAGQSRQFHLDVLSPPVITRQPTNQAVLDGATAAFTVSATGGEPLYYQWRYGSNDLTDSVNITGSTTTNLTIRSASLSNAGNYDVIVSNAAGVATSTYGRLTIVPSPPVIVQQPTNETVIVKGTAQFTVAALGTKPFTYQWSFDGTNLDGATNATLTLTNVQFDQTGTYAAVITNIYGSTPSSSANLTVTPCDPPPAGLVSWWPAEGNADDIISGNNGTLAGNATYGPGEVGQGFVFDGNGSGVQVVNATNLQLQNLTIEAWIKRGSSSVVSYGSGGNGVIFGYGTGGYLLFVNSEGNLTFCQLGNPAYVSGPAITDTNWHHVAVTDAGGTIMFYLDGVAYPAPAYDVTFTFNTSVGIGYRPDNGDNSFLGSIDEMSVYNRALSSNEIEAIYLAGSAGKCFTPTPPVITTQPENQTVVAGQPATFSVSASGTPPLSYQWTFDGTNLAGATNTTLVLSDVQSYQAGVYAVVVSNLVDSILSSNAALTVLSPPVILTQPTNQADYIGETAGFSVTASGTPPLRYQWVFNQTNLVGATNATLVLANTRPDQAGTYAVEVGNPIGYLLSSNAVLTVNPLPSLGETTSSSFVLIYWPISAPGFVLETSSSLAPANWVPVPSPPIQIGNEYLESIEMTGTNQFFRLQLTQ